MAVDKIRAELGGLARTLQDGELSLRASARENLQLGLVVQHTVTFHEGTADHKGPLSAGVEELGSMGMLQAELGRRLQESQQEAGDWMDRWAAQTAGEYGNRLAPEQCMRERSAIGVEEVCATCRGKTQLICPGCSGARRARGPHPARA